jgi:hypothetical protein
MVNWGTEMHLPTKTVPCWYAMRIHFYADKST